MSEDKQCQCFRCGARRKVFMNMKIDDSRICLCGDCYRDYTLFFEGCVVNPMVMIDNKKEGKE